MYPAIVTDFASMHADKNGMADTLTLDDGQSYSINNHIADLKPEANYRVVCGYITEGKQATLYSLISAYYLRDSSLIAKQDPIGVLSAWKSGKYINMHLLPRTQEGEQYWGYCIDSLTTRHAHLSLHHSQNNDPTSYSTDVYASIPIDSLNGIAAGDTITLSINTFKGIQTWTMKK